MDCARSAALEDPRFAPVRAGEVDKLQIEISVLTVPQPLAFSSWQDLLSKLQPNRDGVVLKIGPYMATYLPQVWEQIPDKEEFMTSLAEKAGCRGDAWKTPGAEVRIYHVEAFKEGEP
jgi:AmmeMemoRadiSam system protein A